MFLPFTVKLGKNNCCFDWNNIVLGSFIQLLQVDTR